MKAPTTLIMQLTVLVILLASQTSCSRIPTDGTVIKRSTGEMYLIDNRYRRQIPDLRSLLAYGLGKSVSQIPDTQIDTIKLGAALPFVPSSFIMKSTGEVFHLEAGKRRQFQTAQVLAANYPGADVRTIPDSQVESIPLGTPITGTVKVIPQRKRAYDLKILSVNPARGLLEHQPIQVRYQLTVREIGLTGDLQPTKLQGFVCPVGDGTCSTISELQPNQTFTGDSNAFAPAAGSAAPLTIKLTATDASCSPCETILALSEGFFIPVAARYEIAVDDFILDKFRSKFSDTVRISLRSGLQGNSVGAGFCQVVGGNFCAVNVFQGDFGFGPALGPPPGTAKLVRNVRVGSFDLIPEVSTNLIFQYDVENLGHENGEALDSISQAAAGILDALLRRENIDTLGSFAGRIHGLEGCDGPVAVDGKLILNRSDPNLPGVPTLDALTRENGRFTSDYTQFEGTNSPVGCGENSRYRVRWSIYRTSWQ